MRALNMKRFSNLKENKQAMAYYQRLLKKAVKVGESLSIFDVLAMRDSRVRLNPAELLAIAIDVYQDCGYTIEGTEFEASLIELEKGNGSQFVSIAKEYY